MTSALRYALPVLMAGSVSGLFTHARCRLGSFIPPTPTEGDN